MKPVNKTKAKRKSKKLPIQMTEDLPHGISPEQKPRFLPDGSKVKTIFGTGIIKPCVKEGYWEVEITEPAENCPAGKYRLVDAEINKILEYAPL